MGESKSCAIKSIIKDSGPDFSRGERILKVLANPTRLRMAYLMCKREVCNCEFEGLFEKHQTLISHHIKEFKKAGLINERREAKWRKYSISDATLRALLSMLVEGEL